MRSSGKDCFLIILFQLYGSKAGLFDIIYSGWVIVGTFNPIFIELNAILKQPI